MFLAFLAVLDHLLDAPDLAFDAFEPGEDVFPQGILVFKRMHGAVRLFCRLADVSVRLDVTTDSLHMQQEMRP
jgi:hypothetical protein